MPGSSESSNPRDSAKPQVGYDRRIGYGHRFGYVAGKGVSSCLQNLHRKFPLLQKEEDETAIVGEGQKEEEDNMNPININVATPNNSARFSQGKEAQTSCVAVAGMERRSANLRPSN
ncbi:hypothetical protein DY000_02060635 [Brassica cretica]|uniref:Uncharacterized protein n=1 Tax=Brassica cretica TaxID=69181 RepID=A0ABQ7AU95_BRACR|nr:hypothetical protein DY000_02060635 [Brassica cretica]